MKSLFYAVLILALAVPVDVVQSCCMVPVDYAGRISQNAQQAILFHHGKRQELVLAIDYTITGEAMPESFAWIITVPAEPDAYHLADKNIFRQVNSWAKRLVTPPPPPQNRGGGGCGCAAPLDRVQAPTGAVELGRFAEVGPYAIQPVRAVGANALEGLNAWLQENGFPTEDPAHMKYFVDNNFTFLCIKVSPTEGKDAVASGGDLSPLQISFESEKVYYPLRFSSRQGVFDLELVTLTREPIDYQQSKEALHKISWLSFELYRNVLVVPNRFPTHLSEVYDRHQLGEVSGDWYLNLFQCRLVNMNDSIAKWDEDVFLVTDAKVEPHHASLWSPGLLWLALMFVGVWGLRRLLPFAFGEATKRAA